MPLIWWTIFNNWVNNKNRKHRIKLKSLQKKSLNSTSDAQLLNNNLKPKVSDGKRKCSAAAHSLSTFLMLQERHWTVASVQLKEHVWVKLWICFRRAATGPWFGWFEIFPLASHTPGWRAGGVLSSTRLTNDYLSSSSVSKFMLLLPTESEPLWSLFSQFRVRLLRWQ